MRCAFRRLSLIRGHLLVFLLVLLCASQASASNFVTVDPASLPDHILNEEAVERIISLRGGDSKVGLLSNASPDGRSLLAEIETSPDVYEMGIFDLQTAELTPIRGIEEYSVLRSAWLDDDLLRLILTSWNSPSYYLGHLDRRDGQLWVQPDPLPIAGGVLSLAPNGRRLALTAAIESVPAEAVANNMSSAATKNQKAPVGQMPMREAQMISLPLGFVDAQDDAVEITAEVSELLVLDLETLALRSVMKLPATSRIDAVNFSPDGKTLAMVHNYIDPDLLPSHTPSRGEEFQSLMNLITQDALGRIPPTENPFHINSFIYLFDLADPAAEPRSIASSDLGGGFPQFASVEPQWSPSGDSFIAHILYPAILDGRDWPVYSESATTSLLQLNHELQVVGQIAPPPVHLAKQPHRVFWTSTDELLMLIIERSDQVIYRYQLSSARLSEVIRGGTIFQLVPVPAQNAAVMMRTTASQAPELWRLDLAGGEVQQLTSLNAAATAAADVVAYPVEFSLGSGDVFGGYWFAPSSMAWPPSQQPVVFWQQGGPGDAMLNGWGVSAEHPYTVLPTFGISVLMVALHQRPGNSPEVWKALANGKNFGTVDVDALAEIATQLIERGWASPQGLGLTGCSYGGYLSAQSIVRYPELWAASNPQCTVADWISEFQTGYAGFTAYLFGATPWDDWQHYIDASPGYFGAQVQADTLIFHGAMDFLAISIMENYLFGIESSGLAHARMLRFIGEEHGISDDDAQVYAIQEQIRWFSEHLQ